MTKSPATTPTPAPAEHLAFLDEIEGEAALAWVDERQADADSRLATARFKELQTDIRTILDSDDKIPGVSECGEYLYNFWTDAAHQRGLWRRTTWESYRSDNPQWEVLLDIDALSEAEDTQWVWHGAQVLRPSCTRALVHLSRGGSDADITREFDLETKQFLPDGFSRAECKGFMAWADTTGDTVLVGADFGEGTLTDSGYPRIVKRVRRGQDLADGEVLFTADSTDISAGASYHRLTGRTFVSSAVTFYTNRTYDVTSGEPVLIDVPESADCLIWRDHLLVLLRHDWEELQATAGSVLAFDYADFLTGGRDCTTLFTPDDHSTMEDITCTRHHVHITVLRDVHARPFIHTPQPDGSWHSRPLDLPDTPFASLHLGAVNADESDDLWLFSDSFTTPSSLQVARIDEAGQVRELETLKTLPAYFDATGVQVSQHFATSSDGTRIPYFVLTPPTDAPSPRPTLLYGYGGFEISLTPGYMPGVGKAWLERGGVYVIANIRGGGEYGPRWHQAALKENRHRAYEDFAAVARDLVERGTTTASQLGAMGGSNGGLLMGMMLTKYPELFGAIVCQVPLLDMRRYHTLLAGASWQAEYGNPDIDEQWEFIRTFSPFHIFDPEGTYPPVLFTTSTRDDRVHPAHARTMAYQMLAAGKDVTYVENKEGGHAGASTSEQRARMSAYAFEFLWQKLSPSHS
ncbi:MAG: prolyl oligopeptidase family serine peptidase [Bowdeniella nasicola]|nr:prolyl oligopeptidase family serine peptidase [Bowdeniella nasicola]